MCTLRVMPKTKLPPRPIIRRRVTKLISVFIDGTSLDRAARRLKRRISVKALLVSLEKMGTPLFARYYTLLPYEDDARQSSFLTAVERQGASVVFKRLPPKGIERQVSVDALIGADIAAYSAGMDQFLDIIDVIKPKDAPADSEVRRQLIVVCPSHDLIYSLELANKFGVETITADFGSLQHGNLLKSSKQFIDLTDAKDIWLDE